MSGEPTDEQQHDVIWYRGALEEAPLPPELFLRELLDIDPWRLHQTVDFVTRYGVIWRSYAPSPLGVLSDRSVNRRRARLNDVAASLASAQALTRHWLLVTEEDASPRELSRVWLAVKHVEEGVNWQLAAIDETEESEPGAHERFAWRHFADGLNAGLEAIHPEARLQGDLSLDHALRNMPSEMLHPTFDLFSGLCVQLFNALIDDDTPRRCANETCGRPFIRQQGGARYGQHRSVGVIYCEPQCARAQAQRVYRRRKRDERGQP